MNINKSYITYFFFLEKGVTVSRPCLLIRFEIKVSYFLLTGKFISKTIKKFFTVFKSVHYKRFKLKQKQEERRHMLRKKNICAGMQIMRASRCTHWKLALSQVHILFQLRKPTFIRGSKFRRLYQLCKNSFLVFS